VVQNTAAQMTRFPAPRPGTGPSSCFQHGAGVGLSATRSAGNDGFWTKGFSDMAVWQKLVPLLFTSK